ncbi:MULTISPECIES: hypothetical protein [Bradyrhizobium]|uniref:hypothetical protein n=1 Tax=Bradyrhizobium TaxID=374 RepID=UPI001BADDEA4|nr:MULTISPECIES: hypothetical protein [Bradyrhizobium]MBR1033800.1 hypothetical protein [Bradyrhizobium liaoningense]MCP1774902.1 hypothetical protein [Bradyrhizobium japonicum]MCP1962098.1 hypothetical protein [Bradyrhizobium japonicum]
MTYFSSPAEANTFAAHCRSDAVLSKWLSPEQRDPRALRAAARSRPQVKWAVADDFFLPERIEELAAEHSTLAFEEDDVGLNYHSNAVRVDRLASVSAMTLFRSSSWRMYVAFVTGAIPSAARTVVKFRSHPKQARGFWPHTDQDHHTSKSAAVLGYFNRNWTSRDGGLLQLWHVWPDKALQGDVIFRWHDFIDKRLDFLEGATEIAVEIVTENGGRIVCASLLDQIVPQYNRVVFLNFQHSPAFHSVTPSFDRERNGFVQWFF